MVGDADDISSSPVITTTPANNDLQPSPSSSSSSSISEAVRPTTSSSSSSSSNAAEQLLPAASSSLISLLEPSILLHLLSFLTGMEALENWKASVRTCPLCPQSTNESCISPEAAELRGQLRIVCKDWCRTLSGPFLRSLGIRSRFIHQHQQQQHNPIRSFNAALNGSRHFAYIKHVTMALPLRMALDDPLDSWHQEIASLTPKAANGECGIVDVRLEVEDDEWTQFPSSTPVIPPPAAAEGDNVGENEEENDGHHHPQLGVAGGGEILGGLGGQGPNNPAVMGGGGGGMAMGHGDDGGGDNNNNNDHNLPSPVLLPVIPPPSRGLVLRELCLSGIDSYLTDSLAQTILQNLTLTVTKLSFARCSKLQLPLAPLLTPIAPSLKELALDGCFDIPLQHLREIEAARPKLSIDLLHECFGNGRGGGAWQGRPCGMKEVVILTGKHRGAWTKCWVMHKAGPLRYHVFVLPTEKYDHAIGFSNRAALDISRRHLRHFCPRKEPPPPPSPPPSSSVEDGE